MAKLIFIGDKFAGRVYELVVEKTTVGRGDHNTLTILDASVSSSHCEILVYGTEVIVRDLGSSNGTLVNGKRLESQQQRPLDNGQIVQFGSVEARLELLSESDSDTVTGLTGFHAYARVVNEQHEPKPATAVTARIEPSLAGGDQTLNLTRSTPATESKSPPEPAAISPIEESSGKLRLISLVVAAGLGLVILFWLVVLRGR